MDFFRLVPHELRQILKIKLKRKMGMPDTILSLQRLQATGFCPKYAIDVGAYIGEFTIMFKKIFIKTQVLMVEPQIAKEFILESVCARYPDCQYRLALVGAENKDSVPFLLEESNSRVFVQAEAERDNIIMKQVRLDDITSDGVFISPEFLKIDVQGYELEVIKGAPRILSNVEVILMEVSLIPIGGAPLFYDVVKLMDERGFRLYDICNFIYRPLDGALWQIDVIFVKKTSFLVASNKWAR